MDYKAFVSSTFVDLKSHRAAVIVAMRKAGIHVDPMEDWAAASDEPSKLSQERLSDCDLCVLLVAFRRGHVPGGEGPSITQLEYEAALKHGMKVLVFMLADDEPWPRKFDELDKDPLIGAWRTELRERHTCSPFGFDPASIDIEPALVRWIAERHAGQPDTQRSPPRSRPFMADPLPEGFVERSEKFTEIKRKLIDAQGEPVAITAALRGAGGFGKTALANALCHDSEIKDAFSDGILRVILGEKPNDLVGQMADLIEILTCERPGVTHLEAAKTMLAEALDDRCYLLVIDDAWRPQDLAPFLHRGPKDRTTRLITTRDDGVLPKGAVRVAVDAMTPDQARTMLARGLPAEALSAVRDRLTRLADRLGEWPLLLELANGVLCARIDDGESLAQALDHAERSLQKRGISRAFLPNDPEERRRTASGTLDMSLERLGSRQRERLAELAVFVEDAKIPIDAALGLWRQTALLDDIDGDDLLAQLSRLSLLLEFDRARRVLRLHDVVRTLLREGLATGRLAELDHHLVAYWRSTCGGRLADLSNAYALRHLILHLRGAGEADTVAQLLADPEWIASKLQHLGIQSLLTDYVGPARQTAPFAIGAALTLAANTLARRPQELPAQLLARLSPEEAPELASFLERVRAGLIPPALVPLRPTFTPPGTELRRFEGHESAVDSVTVLADGRRALSGSWDKTLRLWDLETGAELRRFEGHENMVSSVAVLVDGRHALSGSFDKTLRLWDLETGAELRRFEGHEGEVNSVTVLADGRRALSGSNDRTMRLWDLETRAELRRFEGHEAGVMSVTVLTDGRRALSGSYDRTMRLWDLETGAELRRFDGHENMVSSVTVLADGQRALSGSFDWTLRLWDLETGAELHRFDGHESGVFSVTVLADGQRALSGSYDRTLRLWHLETGAELRRFEGHEGWVSSVAMLADGWRALSGSLDKTLRLWNLETGAELRHFEGHEREVYSVTVLADGRRALSGSHDRTLRLWDLETGAELRRFEGHEGEVNSVTVLADGRRALSGSWDNMLRLWDLETGAELRRFEGHEDAVSSVTMLADGRRALSGSWDKTLRLWDLETGAELRRFEGHENQVGSVTMLAEGRRALSGSWDKTLRLWDLETGAELRRFEGHEGGVNSVMVLADGQRALSGSRDKTLRLWDLEAGAELACLTLDAVPWAFEWSERLPAAIVGDGFGRVHVIELVDRPTAAAPTSCNTGRTGEAARAPAK